MENISKILKMASAAHRLEERAKILKQYESHPLKVILNARFNPRVKWLLPEGKPPYSANNEDPEASKLRLYRDVKLLSAWVEGGKYPNMKPRKREDVFISVLESVHPDDAALLIALKEGQWPEWCNRITQDVAEMAFSQLKKLWKTKETKVE